MSDFEIYKPIDDLAEVLQVKPQTLRAWIRQGIIPRNTYIKAANTYRFNIPQVIGALRAGEELEEHVDEVTGASKESVSDLAYETTSTTQKRPSLEEELGFNFDENEDF